tara:strand:+ start:535 stop:1425 length:891 start_codon:yes stop_codon:yes gene_type:complete
MYAPIIIFTHKRFNHLKQLLHSLKKNPETKNSTVYFFIDGPKNYKDKILTDKIFNFLKRVNYFRSQKIFYRKKNLGSANSILEGVNYVSKIEKKFIVLEEDLIVSDEFLFFCNKTLQYYEKKKEVWHINCWIFENINSDEKFFFSTHMSCWGWATWSNRWNRLNKIRKKQIYFDVKKNFKGRFDYLSIGSYLSLLLNYRSKINTWAVYWYYLIFKKNGLTITPFKTLVINTGFNLKSTNTKINYYHKLSIKKNTLGKNIVYKKPFLDEITHYKLKKLYLKKNLFLIIFVKIKELIN